MIILCFILFISCTTIDEDRSAETVRMFDENKITNPKIIINRSGNRIVEAQSDILIKNSNKEAHLYGNVISDFFNDGGVHVSKLYADSATIQQNTNNLNAFGNVEVVSDSGYKLFSNSIIWDNQYQLILSKDSVMFTSNNQDTMYGIGFESDMDLTRAKVLKPYGIGGK